MVRRFAILLLAIAPLLVPGAAGADCTTCHAKVRQDPAWAHTYEDWEGSIHAFNGVSCVTCHGGDVNAKQKAKAHQGLRFTGQAAAGGTEARLAVVAVCAQCHEDQYRGYRVSPHYKALSSGRTAADCATCHGAVGGHVLNARTISATCRRCHEDRSPGNTVDVARTMLEFTHRVRMALVFPEPGHRLTGRKREKVEEAITAAMAAWHEFNLETVGNALAYGTGVLDQ